MRVILACSAAATRSSSAGSLGIRSCSASSISAALQAKHAHTHSQLAVLSGCPAYKHREVPHLFPVAQIRKTWPNRSS
jgi:hypothetical protein